ncbi:MAG: hemerythrin domain-containing protein [Syntrophales bacterium]|nr:hemerythrin domain-containing protein [Syntrophales bacterium]MDY0045727.1 hemerythrin domain-containing protein [Syntrophales bacterium]
MHNDFFKVLEKDHDEIKSILEKLEKTSEGSQKTREDYFEKLKEELIPHMRAEESHFYPALKKKDETRETALEALEEHHVAELVLMELDKMPKKEENWGAKLTVLKELIEHHIEEEEEEVFEDAKEYLDEGQMERILTEFKKEKEHTKQNLS